MILQHQLQEQEQNLKNPQPGGSAEEVKKDTAGAAGEAAGKAGEVAGEVLEEAAGEASGEAAVVVN